MPLVPLTGLAEPSALPLTFEEKEMFAFFCLMRKTTKMTEKGRGGSPTSHVLNTSSNQHVGLSRTHGGTHAL